MMPAKVPFGDEGLLSVDHIIVSVLSGLGPDGGSIRPALVRYGNAGYCFPGRGFGKSFFLQLFGTVGIEVRHGHSL